MNLEQFGVQDLNVKELEKTEGGSIFYWVEMWGGLNFINNASYGMNTGGVRYEYA
tara:strand:- start:242 stop:406 length:165 start_codon:yes stop_codon:yes gene_type:complete